MIDMTVVRCSCTAARHFASFAMASYGYALLKLLGLMDESHDLFLDGARATDIVTFQLGLDADDILMANLEGEELGLPRHYVARDKQTKSIVIAIRGTNSVSDVLVDLLCDSAPFANGYAHSGMRDAANALYTATLPTLRSALAQNVGYQVVVSGHSLGAGVATLLTKVLLDNGFKGVKCYAISPPPVFGPAHVVDRRWSDALECFVNEDDLVPRLSLESARALIMELEKVGQPDNKNDDEEAQLSDGMFRASAMENVPATDDRRHRAVAPLCIPSTTVHWLTPNTVSDPSTAAFKSTIVEASTFRRMLITSGCVTAHFPNRYVLALNSLRLPPPAQKRPRLRTRPVQPAVVEYYGELGF